MEERRNQQNRPPQQGQSGSRQQGAGQQQQSDANRQQQGGVSGLGDSSQARSQGQQGGQSGPGQQRQFDQQGVQQGGGSGSDSRFADQIREHMEVIDDNGQRVGTVDHVDGDRIKLARSDSKDGQHHYVSLSQISGIEGNKVRLRERGDNDYGMETRS